MDANDWNSRYDTDELIWTIEANQFLVSEVAGLKPGTALDLACGEGRNAVWLAMQGWEVTGVDFASVGLSKAQRIAIESGVTGTWITADATDWTAPTEGFDLVAMLYLQLPASERQKSIRTAVSAMAPDGTILIIAHHLLNLIEGHGGPQDANFLMTPEDVVDDLAAAELGLDVELVVERSTRVDRVVQTPDGPRTAIDMLVRARRIDTTKLSPGAV
jgi:SAM-dependent methyltransferase